MASRHALISNGFLRAKIFVVFIIMIVFSFNAAKLRKNNHNDFIECFKNFIKFILLPKLPPIQEEEVLLLDVASLEDEVEIMNTLYLLHLSREGFVFILGVLDIHLADALTVYPIKTDFDAAAQHVARGRNLKLTCTLLEVNTLHEDILILINIRPSAPIRS